MDEVISYLKERGVPITILEYEINHEAIKKQQERKGYVPINKKYTVKILKGVPTKAGVYIFLTDNKSSI